MVIFLNIMIFELITLVKNMIVIYFIKLLKQYELKIKIINYRFYLYVKFLEI